MKKKHAYFNGEPEADVRRRYLSLLRGWEREQKEGPSYWMSSEKKRNHNYSLKLKRLRKEKRA